MSFEQGCTAILNPLSCIGLRDTTIAHGARGVIITAAYSQLGKMLIQAFYEKGIRVIAVVRKDSQKEELEKTEGVDACFNSETDTFV